MVHEDPSDIRGEVAEEVAYVGVLGNPPAREFRPEAIDNAATIRVSLRELKLPVGQDDGPKVLRSGFVLRERSNDRRMAMQRMSDSPLEDGWTRGERPENVLAIASRICS